MKRRSMRRELMLVIAAWQVLLVAGLCAVAFYATRKQLLSAFDSTLESRIMSLAALVHYTEEAQPRLAFASELVPPPLEHHRPDYFRITNEAGERIAQSRAWVDADAAARSLADRDPLNVTIEGHRYRGVLLRRVPVLDPEEGVVPQTLDIIYLAPTDRIREALLRTGAYLAGGGALLLAVTMLLSAWGLQRGLRPLSALAAEAALVSPSNWHLPGNVAVEATDELAPLAQAMQAMLDNLRKAFTQQREFLANAAHELKTPVAILKSTLQALLQRQRSAGEYRAGLEEALEDMARLEKLLHSMLRLARAEQWATGSVQPDAAPVNAMESLQAAIDRLAPIAAERDVTIEVKGEREALVRTSSEDLELVWANLLENAIHFSPAGAQVAATIRKQNRRILLVVEDRGPGIPESELPRIFERFHRVDVSRARHTGGYGLGLAISKALVEAYGGDLRAESKAGIGTRLTASFPEAARALAKEPQTTFSVP